MHCRDQVVRRLFGGCLLLVFATWLSGCSKSPGTNEASRPLPSGAEQVDSNSESHQNDSSGDDVVAEIDPAERLAFIKRMKPTVEKFCGDCHVMPQPSSSSRHGWAEEVEQGFMLYRTSGRQDLEVPNQDDVLRFFRYQAPESLTLPESVWNNPPCPIKLRPTSVRLPGTRPPGVTNVRWMNIGLKATPALVYCNIGTGAVTAHWPQEPGAPTLRLATLLQPVHAEVCDLDQDGLTDLVVADIGEFNADDSDLGRVVWLRRMPETDTFKSIVLQDGLSRVADVRPGDFDHDGDLDLVVAVFGWRNSGRTVLLKNEGPDEQGELQFELQDIDPRHGPIHVPTIDLNHDGHLDFVDLISQDQEVIEAFINDGEGNFKPHTIWRAPDPAYGSSGIELVDLDGDGDQDILYTNGDSLDRGPKPYHSIQWLENQGELKFEHHHICYMPGVLNATAADFDGDGDQDIVAGSLLQGPPEWLGTPSIIMLVQTAPGEFQRTQVETGKHQHLSLAAGDFNADGRNDFASGVFARNGPVELPELIIWWNEQ